MTGVEIDFVVKDSLEAFKLYEGIFGAEKVEITSYEKGLNEAVFTIYSTRFHILDENPKYQLVAPIPGDPKPMWLNVVVPDIKVTYEKAMAAGCIPVQPLTELKEMGVINGMFADPFGYLWMLHEIVREVSFEDRMKIMEEKMK